MEEPFEIERGPRVGIPGGSGAIRPKAILLKPLTAEERAKFEGLLGEAPEGGPQRAEGQPLTMLIVDRDPSARYAITRNFDDWGFQVLEAGDGAAALKTVATQRIDILLLNLKLAGLDGFQLIRGVRSFLRISDTVIIVIAEPADPLDEPAALDLGADNFIKRPYTQAQLVSTLKAAARRLFDHLRPG